MTATDVPWDAGFTELLTSVLPRVTAPLDPALDLKAVGLDSMATIELLVRLEDQYDVEIPEAKLTGATFATPGALWAVLATQRTAANA